MKVSFNELWPEVVEHVSHVLTDEEDYRPDEDYEVLYGPGWTINGIRAIGDRAIEVAQVIVSILREVE